VLGYANELLLLCGQIVRRLTDDRIERMFMRLIKQPRAVIDAVAMAEPRTLVGGARDHPCGEEKRKALILWPLPGEAITNQRTVDRTMKELEA
jgi:hypothetical protein